MISFVDFFFFLGGGGGGVEREGEEGGVFCSVAEVSKSL